MKFLLDVKDGILLGLIVIVFSLCVYVGVTEAWSEFKHQWYLEALGNLIKWSWGGLMSAMFIGQFLEESSEKDPFIFDRIFNDKIPPFRSRDTLPKE